MPALDTETTGIDHFHGTMPYLVTTCNEDGNTFWEWDVDPLTRKPIIPKGDVQSIARYMHEHDHEPFILQNGKFDVHGLRTLGLWKHYPLEKFWNNYHDTLIAGHVLASSKPHNLTAMAAQYLGIDILKYEDVLEDCCKAARRMVRLKMHALTFKGWRVAKHGQPDMPSVSKSGGGGKKNVQADTAWKNDTWLLRAIAKRMDYPVPSPGCEHDWDKNYKCGNCKGHRWWIVASEYANPDSAITLMLWRVMEQQLKARDLWDIYLVRLQSMRLAYTLETNGVTGSIEAVDTLTQQYQEERDAFAKNCVDLARDDGYTLEMPKSGLNESIREYCFDKLKLPVIARSEKTGNPTLSKDVRAALIEQLPPRSKELSFITNISDKLKRETMLAFMAGYRRFWIPLQVFNDRGEQLWYCLHPSLNPTGSDTLRWSSSNPNSQNISKQDAACRRCKGDEQDRKGCRRCKGTGYEYRSMRLAFGPAPGREWWSCDAKNIELRLPFYEAKEPALIELFERPDDPPYYGSNHLANFHAVYPDIWAEVEREVGYEKVGPTCKKRFGNSWYQYCKNGGFAKQYGGQRRKVDSTFRKDGAFDLLDSKFANLAKLNKKQIQFAEKHGYVETIPDRTVNPRKGYPLLCTRTEYGKILPTVPLSYHVQGTAMWWTLKAMIRCQEQLDKWNTDCRIPHHYRIALQVHDEIVFDFPKSESCPIKEAERLKKDPNGFKRPDNNLWRIRILMRLMEKGGEDIGIPTPVGVEYHSSNWAEGVTL